MEAMEITFDAARIKLAMTWVHGESQIWWEWVRVSRDPETMTWGEFRELFMGKFFPAFSRHAKAREFLELKQGNMIVLEYVTPQPPPRWMKGTQNYTGTLYLLFQTLVGPSLTTESKYHIQRYKIKLPP